MEPFNQKNRTNPSRLAFTLLLGAFVGCGDPNPVEEIEQKSEAISSAGRTCGSAQPSAAQVQATSNVIRARFDETMRGAQRPAANIPVWFHVLVSASGAGNVPDSMLTRQLQVLNDSYNGNIGKEGGAKTRFRFSLAGVTRTVNQAWYTMGPDSAAEAQAKSALRRGGPETLNVYVAGIRNNLLGWATFPEWYAASPKLDGIVLLNGSLPGGDETRFNLGNTGTHEVGHWLGSYHTFEGACSKANDLVIDTPAERTAATGCPVGRNTCATAGGDPIRNFMDYTDDACMNAFSKGQAARMDAMAAHYRRL